MSGVALSRPVAVHHLAPGGQDVVLEATSQEREALAAELGLVALASLTGRFRLAPTRGGVRVEGRVEAALTQTCVVSLDPFDSVLDEEMSVDFVEAAPEPDPRGPEHEADLDAADEIVGGRIDLGALTAEFLVLSLDPYPRKPGVAFETGGEPESEPETSAGPFAALREPDRDT